MDLDKIKFDEKLLVEDINHNLEVLKLDELNTENEIHEAVGIITDLCSRFRHIHVGLRESDENHATNYPEYGTISTKLQTYDKASRLRLKTIREDEEKEGLVQQVRNGALDIESLKIRYEMLSDRVRSENGSVDLFTITVEFELNKYVSSMEQFIERYFDLEGEFRLLCPATFTTEFQSKFQTDIFEIRQDIKMAKWARHEVRLARDKLSNANVLNANFSKSENLISEISIRFKSISKRYRINLEELSDYQILDLHQDKSEEVEFSEVLAKVTELAILAPFGGPKSLDMLDKINKTRDRIVSKREDFRDTLSKLVRERDITAEKLKQASDLVVNLPKFTGYNSEMDFFTFK